MLPRSWRNIQQRLRIFLHLLMVFSLFLLTSCASRFISSSHRLITPETQGKRWSSRLGFYQTSGISGRIDLNSTKTDKPLNLEEIPRTRLNLETGLFKKVDLIFSKNSGGDPMVHLKWQFYGGNKQQTAGPHRFATTIGHGSSKGKIEDDTEIDYTSKTQEFSLLHGYRWKRRILFYEGLTYTQSDFVSDISSPEIKTNHSIKQVSIQLGTELDLRWFLLKAEIGYGSVTEPNSKSKSSLSYAVGGGIEF